MTASKSYTITIADERESVARDTREAPGMLATLREMNIASESDLSLANDCLRDVVTRKDDLKTKLKRVTDLLNAPLKEVRGWLIPGIKVAEEAEGILKFKIGAYMTAQAKARDLALQAAMTAQRVGDNRSMVKALNEASTSVTAPAGTGVREVWDAEVIDPSAVPRVYLLVDEAAIRTCARVTDISNIPTPIPGVRFFKKPIVSVRR